MQPVRSRKAALIAATLMLGSATFALALIRRSDDGTEDVRERFAGTSPCTSQLRHMLGIPQEGPCEVVQWQLTTFEDGGDDLRCSLDYSYGVHVPGTTNLAKGSGRIKRTGALHLARGTAADRDASVWRLDISNMKPLHFQSIDGVLLHLLNDRGLPMVGNAGWSFTLNRTESKASVEDKQARRSAFSTAAPKSTDQPVMEFVGRSPGFTPEHPKLKWELTLNSNGSFQISGTLYRQKKGHGTWTTSAQPKAAMYELREYGSDRVHRLRRLSSDVLIFVDESRKPLVGNANFSFTLNRADVQPSQP